jgi:UDP:flavonoid glycosyltransferase YjiC (YdhE family)
VSHAGYGTTLGAIEHGVGHVMLPLFAGDQWRTAHRVEEVGAGIAVHAGERRVFDPPPDEAIAALPEAVLGVLGDARYRETAGRLGAEMAALPAAHAAAAALVARAA